MAPPPSQARSRVAAASASAADTISGQSGRVDPQRRSELLAEARRKRIAWVEEGRGCDRASRIGKTLTRRQVEERETLAAAEEGIDRVLPSALHLLNFLTKLAGDGGTLHTRGGESNSVPREGLSSILKPFLLEDVIEDVGRPVPQHSPGISAYDVLLDKLGHPQGADIVKKIQKFVATCRAEENALATRGGNAFAGMLHTFLRGLEKQMRQHQSGLWRSETEEQWEESKEGLEMFLMHRVYDVAFGLAEDKEKDAALSERLRVLDFLSCEHLDIASFHNSQHAEEQMKRSGAEEELNAIDSMRCPSDKLSCILHTTKIMAKMLSEARTDGSLPGADEFLPALILLVTRANPRRLHSNLEYIQMFREPSKLIGEEGYVLTQLISAVHFLEGVDATTLTITPQEYEEGIKRSQQSAQEDLQEHRRLVKDEVRKEEARLQDAASGDDADGGEENKEITVAVVGPLQEPPLTEPARVSVRRIRNQRDHKGASSHPVAASTASSAAGTEPSSGLGGGGDAKTQKKAKGLRSKLKFAGVTSPLGLKFGDAEGLLDEYQQLLLLCEGLLAEKERKARRR